MPQHRIYGIFKRRRRTADVSAKQWQQFGAYTGRLSTVRVVYQGQLIANSTGLLEPDYEYRLRPMPGGKES